MKGRGVEQPRTFSLCTRVQTEDIFSEDHIHDPDNYTVGLAAEDAEDRAPEELSLEYPSAGIVKEEFRKQDCS
jgi:hypothetical protein